MRRAWPLSSLALTTSLAAISRREAMVLLSSTMPESSMDWRTLRSDSGRSPGPISSGAHWSLPARLAQALAVAAKIWMVDRTR